MGDVDFGRAGVAFGEQLPSQRFKVGDPGGFNAARYTLDLLLPVANLKQRDTFIPHGYATWWVFGLTLGGWLLALVLVAGLTGVFKRD